MEERGIEIAKELLVGLLERMMLRAEVMGFMREGALYLDLKGDREGILIGKHGRTLESLQFLINRMVNKQMKEPVKVFLDINQYKERRADSLTKMAARLGEKAKRMDKNITVGPFNAHDRKIIHLTLKEDPSIETESLGEGEMKRVKIIPKSKEGGRIKPLE